MDSETQAVMFADVHLWSPGPAQNRNPAPDHAPPHAWRRSIATS